MLARVEQYPSYGSTKKNSEHKHTQNEHTQHHRSKTAALLALGPLCDAGLLPVVSLLSNAHALYSLACAYPKSVALSHTRRFYINTSRILTHKCLAPTSRRARWDFRCFFAICSHRHSCKHSGFFFHIHAHLVSVFTECVDGIC